MSTDNSLTDSVKPEDSNPASAPQTEANPSVEANAPNAEAGQASEPGNVNRQSDEPDSRGNARIRQLVSEKNAAKAEVEEANKREAEAKAQAAVLRRQLDALKPKPAGNESDHPNQASFIAATVKEATIEAQRSAIEQQAEQAEAVVRESRERAYQARVSDFQDRAPDYHQVISNPNVQITPLMADAIKDAEAGPELAYYLCKNPEEAARIARMSPVQQAVAIGRLEGKVTIPAKRTTQAPPPVKSVNGGTGTAAFDPDSAPMEEFYKEFMRRL
jgi:hypothetical protein